jgi:hypothetical protein
MVTLCCNVRNVHAFVPVNVSIRMHECTVCELLEAGGRGLGPVLKVITTAHFQYVIPACTCLRMCECAHFCAAFVCACVRACVRVCLLCF